MPSPERVLTEAEARRIVGESGFRAPAVAGSAPRVGVELEWLPVDAADLARPARHESVGEVVAALGPLPGASTITFEPGGQLELSSPAVPGLGACDVLCRDLGVVREALAAAGVALVAVGLEPGHPRDRVVHSPRYDAMEVFFDRDGTAGRTMMRSTAAVQVNLDLGEGAEAERRWRAAHDVGPVLVAAFANSPLARGRPTGWRSTRLAVWFEVDPGRTTPVLSETPGPDSWADYALNARLMFVRRSDQESAPTGTDLTFATWLTAGHPLGWPTADDLHYHLTTLFPPVRPRGWLELRMIDALPDPWWRVAAAVTSALVTEPAIADRVEAATRPVRGRWRDAARHGLAEPALRTAAVECFRSAVETLNGDGSAGDATAAFMDRYVLRGRCPADDRLEAWMRAGRAETSPEDGAPAWT
ncbi:MAG TPA: ergothioneine biosynthesis glutamate--cysteine ligase EgtA [Acidimicrobiia bacterium]